MDLDAYVLAHAQSWRRLEALLGRRRLSGAEGDELVELYQQVATHLSVVRTTAPDPGLIAHLSSLLARARGRIVGTRTGSWRAVGGFLTARFPAALYRLRWWWLGCLAANVVVTAVMMLWLLGHPTVEQSLLSPGEVDQLVHEDFEGYYSEYAASHFAAQVWINNAWVTGLCLALGVLGLPVVYLLFTNIANLAIIGSVMHRHEHGQHFWGLLLPHGLLELTAVFVAGGVGLRLFWAWVEPGELTRSQSLAREGRTAGTVALGLVLVLLVSGVIEAFVTPSGLPTWARLAIGILAEAAFLAYVFVLGRAAAAQGHTGDLDASLLEDRVATQA
ncbi:stage II sporulation protein M [Nocardioides sp. dk4132]|uniref:stage II sporulation protein M n=1 Tax=unclassified Nocardioides TaxID=2615069 RepID=UPI00129618F9|nr:MULTISPECIES: stage II sporulation protein M [unclassified Nocardioides]MQW74665.1 stage II sporulation protein M [Nocardioides sp. dk4132]QGA06574.1 stage II sporulation protein M [Nocardioides sp. dk884]